MAATSEFGAALTQDREGDLVAHHRGRQVHGLFLAEQLGAAAFELEHGRVLALLLVADLGVHHRVAHGLRRLRRRVGTEIDHRRRLYAGRMRSSRAWNCEAANAAITSFSSPNGERSP